MFRAVSIISLIISSSFFRRQRPARYRCQVSTPLGSEITPLDYDSHAKQRNAGWLLKWQRNISTAGVRSSSSPWIPQRVEVVPVSQWWMDDGNNPVTFHWNGQQYTPAWSQAVRIFPWRRDSILTVEFIPVAGRWRRVTLGRCFHWLWQCESFGVESSNQKIAVWLFHCTLKSPVSHNSKKKQIPH